MLTSFSVENYRSFADETTIELRPLTLLFGYNNVGKSALIRALALIADSTQSGWNTPLKLTSEAARRSTFDEICSKVTGGKFIRFGLTNSDLKSAFEYTLAQPIGTVSQVIESIRINAPAPPVTFEWEPSGDYLYRLGGPHIGVMKFRFDGLWPSPLSSSSIFQIAEASTVGLGISLAQQTLSELKNGLQWLGSVRQFPSRIVEYLGSAPRNISYNGAGVGEILVQDMLANGPLLREVSQWYQDSFKRKLDVQQLQDGRYSLTLEPLAMTGDRAVNLADTGEGIAQVLPVLVAAAMANRGGPTDPTILAIEQPELHLHPAVHDKLAKYLCDIAATKKPRMLIETHSENFLLGVQIQIVKREIAPEDVLIYWVMQGDDGASRVQRITLDKDGYPDDFPEGVFEEDLDLAQRLRELRKSVKP